MSKTDVRARTDKELESFLDAWFTQEKKGSYSLKENIDGREKLKEFSRSLHEGITVPIEPYEGETEEKKEKNKLSKRTIVAFFILVGLIPITVFIGIKFMGDRWYYFISLMFIIYAMLPFFMIFESRKPKARELVVIATLSAITVAGRTAFFMTPSFKPVAAMVILSAVTFGSEAGFLVGCLSMFVSNFLFSQGPWTPWQMFSFGVIGFLAGILFQKGKLKRTRFSLCIFGFLSVLFIYGGIMNPASLLMYTDHITWKGILAFYISGIPVDLVHASSTVFFLWLGAKPMIEKLERIKKKYGLLS